MKTTIRTFNISKNIPIDETKCLCGTKFKKYKCTKEDLFTEKNVICIKNLCPACDIPICIFKTEEIK